MVTVISRFRVANGMRSEVQEAFKARPGLVEYAPGFRSIEIHCDVCDPDIFYLYTVWEDLDSFKAWHGSDAHRQSHRGIPKGLKLDAQFTRVQYLYDHESCAAEQWSFVRKFCSRSQSIYLVEIDGSGVITYCTGAFADVLGVNLDSLVGTRFACLLNDDENRRFEQKRNAPERNAPASGEFVLTFLPCSLDPIVLRCELLSRADRTLLLAERLSNNTQTHESFRPASRDTFKREAQP